MSVTTWKSGFPQSNQGPNRIVNDDDNGLLNFLESVGLQPNATLVTTIQTTVGGGGYTTPTDVDAILQGHDMLDATGNVLVPVLAASWKCNATPLMTTLTVAWDATDLPAPYTALVQPKFHITAPTLTDLICDEDGLYQVLVNDVWTPDGGAISPYVQTFEILYKNVTALAEVNAVQWAAGESGVSMSATVRMTAGDHFALGCNNSSAVRNGGGKTTITIYKIAN